MKRQFLSLLTIFVSVAACKKTATPTAPTAPTGYNYTSKMAGIRPWKGIKITGVSNNYTGSFTTDSEMVNTAFALEIVNDTFIVINGDKLQFAIYDTFNKRICYTYNSQSSSVFETVSATYYYTMDSIVYQKRYTQTENPVMTTTLTDLSSL